MDRDKTKGLAAARKYYQKHKAERLAYGRKYYQEHKAEHRAYASKYCQKHREFVVIRMKRRPLNSGDAL